jgi:epsilon-lactone hydrolase
MPSLTARLVSFALRSSGLLRRRFAGGPGFQAMLAKVQAQKVAEPRGHNLDIQRSEYDGRPVWTIKPKSGAPTANILYWHGGGYVFPVASAHWSFLCRMATKHGWSITAPLYPLAPGQGAEQITAWALGFYRDYAKRTGRFFMGGDSAGGGLTASTAQAARDEALPAAAGLILICPWLDANPDEPEQAKIEPRDAVLTLSGIRDCGTTFASGLPLDDPRVSPIFGAWNNLPPILCFAGGDDLLVTDARALKTELPDMDYDEQAGMIHVWPILPFPESRIVQGKMAEFTQASALVSAVP